MFDDTLSLHVLLLLLLCPFVPYLQVSTSKSPLHKNLAKLLLQQLLWCSRPCTIVLVLTTWLQRFQDNFSVVLIAIEMNRMVYVLPEMVMIILLEVAYVVLSFLILVSYYCNICCKNCCGVNSCLHSILKRTKIVKHVSETTTEFYGFLIEENSIIIYFLVWYIIWILFGAAIVFFRCISDRGYQFLRPICLENKLFLEQWILQQLCFL